MPPGNGSELASAMSSSILKGLTICTHADDLY